MANESSIKVYRGTGSSKRLIATSDGRNVKRRYNPETGARRIDIAIDRSGGGRKIYKVEDLSPGQRREIRRKQEVERLAKKETIKRTQSQAEANLAAERANARTQEIISRGGYHDFGTGKYVQRSGLSEEIPKNQRMDSTRSIDSRVDGNNVLSGRRSSVSSGSSSGKDLGTSNTVDNTGVDVQRFEKTISKAPKPSKNPVDVLRRLADKQRFKAQRNPENQGNRNVVRFLAGGISETTSLFFKPKETIQGIVQLVKNPKSLQPALAQSFKDDEYAFFGGVAASAALGKVGGVGVTKVSSKVKVPRVVSGGQSITTKIGQGDITVGSFLVQKGKKLFRVKVETGGVSKPDIGGSILRSERTRVTITDPKGRVTQATGKGVGTVLEKNGLSASRVDTSLGITKNNNVVQTQYQSFGLSKKLGDRIYTLTETTKGVTKKAKDLFLSEFKPTKKKNVDLTVSTEVGTIKSRTTLLQNKDVTVLGKQVDKTVTQSTTISEGLAKNLVKKTNLLKPTKTKIKDATRVQANNQLLLQKTSSKPVTSQKTIAIKAVNLLTETKKTTTKKPVTPVLAVSKSKKKETTSMVLEEKTTNKKESKLTSRGFFKTISDRRIKENTVTSTSPVSGSITDVFSKSKEKNPVATNIVGESIISSKGESKLINEKLVNQRITPQKILTGVAGAKAKKKKGVYEEEELLTKNKGKGRSVAFGVFVKEKGRERFVAGGFSKVAALDKLADRLKGSLSATGRIAPMSGRVKVSKGSGGYARYSDQFRMSKIKGGRKVATRPVTLIEKRGSRLSTRRETSLIQKAKKKSVKRGVFL